MKITGLIAISLLLLLNSCRKDSFITSPDARVSISADTLKYDTVFVTAAGRPLGNSNALKQTYVIIRTDSSLSFTGFIVFGEDKNYSSGMLLENRYGYSKKGFFIMNKICASFGFPLVYTKEADF